MNTGIKFFIYQNGLFEFNIGNFIIKSIEKYFLIYYDDQFLYFINNENGIIKLNYNTLKHENINFNDFMINVYLKDKKPIIEIKDPIKNPIKDQIKNPIIKDPIIIRNILIFLSVSLTVFGLFNFKKIQKYFNKKFKKGKKIKK